VPGLLVVLELLLPPPPPQASKVAASRTRKSDPKASFNRRLLVGMSNRKIPAKMAPAMGANQGGAFNGPITADGAVVLTVSVVFPLVVKEVELNEQLPPVIVEETWQVKLTAPVNPLMGLSPIVEVPDWPGAAMLMLDGLGTKLKSAVPLVTEMATAAEAGLAA